MKKQLDFTNIFTKSHESLETIRLDEGSFIVVELTQKKLSLAFHAGNEFDFNAPALWQQLLQKLKITSDDKLSGQESVLIKIISQYEPQREFKRHIESLGWSYKFVERQYPITIRHTCSPSRTQVEVLNSTSTKIENKKVRVMILDDSHTMRSLLRKILQMDARLEVIGDYGLPSELHQVLESVRPDVITVDLHMPEENGVVFLQKMMSKHRIPAVIFSALSKEESDLVLRGLEAGAIDYIQKPAFEQLREQAAIICDKIYEASRARTQFKPEPLTKDKIVVTQSSWFDTNSIILIGSSTGGTEAVKDVLQQLPDSVPPILIVQHIPPIFSAAWAERLNALVKFEVHEAKQGEELKANRVYIAPGGTQMCLRQTPSKVEIEINNDAPVNRHKPSVDYLFASAGKLKNKHIVAVLMTGMGADGAQEITKLKKQGYHTIAQNEETCVVFGMPREAIERGGATEVLPLSNIAGSLVRNCKIKIAA